VNGILERVKLHEAGIDLWRVDITRLLVGAEFLGRASCFRDDLLQWEAAILHSSFIMRLMM
jgi:hypothetical protein